ncbi:GTOR [Hexamita inflata]|uniref:GTOR n=1 Tax=Hexamita inflata TaxID=28002 RepID=A0AA86U6Y5_9EUKA|nr:GTOR [Hexamita inflata]
MQVPSRFQDYLEDLRSSQQQVRMAASIKFRVQCEKETSELLSDPRQALLNDVELFLKYLVQSSNECLQLSAASLIQLFLQQKTHLIQISVLEDLILILCSDKKKSIILAGSQCIQDLSLENRPLDQPWSRVFEFMRTQNLKPNAIILAKNLVKYDSQCSHRINGQFLSELWTFILDQKDPAMSQLGVECFVQILGLKNQGQAFQNLLTSLNSSTNQQVLSALQLWEVELLFLVYYVSNYILKYFATSNADDKFQQIISSWRLFMNYSLTQEGQKYDFDRIRPQSTIQSRYLIFQKGKIEITTCNKRTAMTKINAVEDVQGRSSNSLNKLRQF